MAAQNISIRNAVAADLAAATLSLERDVVATQRPDWRADELERVKVSVVASDDRGERESRAQHKHTYTIGCIIQQRINGAEEETQSEALIGLGEEIADFYAQNAFSFAGADWSHSDFVPLFNRVHLVKHSVLTTVVELNFLGWRP
jgi:hypothetical protein